MQILQYSWTKHAAAVLNEDEVERAFADQAYSFVAQRAMKLMSPPNFLGFELVYGNEDKTRLVGVFAFRIGQELLYAPVFFLNGQIRGNELLYRVSQKSFVPLTEEWITYLLEKDQSQPGQQVERRRIDRLQTGTDLGPMIFPRRNTKMAGATAPLVDPTQGADFHMGGVPPLAAGTSGPTQPTAQWNPAADPALLNQPQSTAAGSSMGGTVDGMVNSQLASSSPFDNVGSSAIEPSTAAGSSMAGTVENMANNELASSSPFDGVGSSEITPLVPGNGGGYNADQIASFRRLHGGAFDQSSKMDRWKMDQMASGNMQATNAQYRKAMAGANMKSSPKRAAIWAVSLDAFCPKVASFAPTGLLEKFIREDGGMRAINAIAGAVKSSYAFAEAIMHMADGNLAAFMPEDVIKSAREASVKKASQAVALTIHFGGVKSASTADQFEQMMKRGFAIEDSRDEKELSAVYSEADRNFETVTNGGIYEVPTSTGETGKAIVADTCELKGLPASEWYFGGLQPCAPSSCNDAGGGRRSARRLGIIFQSPRKSLLSVAQGHIMGKPLPDEASERDKAGTKEPSVGNAYAIYNPLTNVVAPQTFWLGAKEKNPNGTWSLVCCTIDRNSINSWDSKVFILNPDAPDSDFGSGLLNGDIRFIELDTEEVPTNPNEITHTSPSNSMPVDKAISIPRKRLVAPPVMLDAQSTMDALIQTGMRRAKINLLDDGRFLMDFGGRHPDSVETKAAAVAVLTGRCGWPAAVALQVVDEVEQTRAVSYVFEPGAKYASAVTRLIDRPDFETDYDSRFSTAVERPQSFVLNTETDQPPIRDIDVNEVWDPSMGGSQNEDHMSDEELLTKDPAELQQLQQTRNLPFMLEHGLVGSLTKTFDAVAMIEKYIPPMEAALDRTGRLVFLFYWKPQDFEKAYGQDDMTDLESELVSNFKSFGTMVLGLLKRTHSARQGSAALV